jgi:uncharacterized phage protein (TIGR02220 family)
MDKRDVKILQDRIQKCGESYTMLFYMFYIINEACDNDDELIFRKSKTKPHDEDSLKELFSPLTTYSINDNIHELKLLKLIEEDVNGFITVCSREVSPDAAIIEEKVDVVFDMFESICGKKFNKKTEGHRKPIRGRIKEGAILDEISDMMKFMNDKWGNDNDMSMYLRPQTLFAPTKFQSYMNAIPRTPKDAVKVSDPYGKIKTISRVQFNMAEEGYYTEVTS